MSKQTFTLQRYFNFLKQINHPVKILCVTALKFEQYVISMILGFFETPCILDDRFIMRKYNELNHRDRAEITIHSNKNNTMASV